MTLSLAVLALFQVSVAADKPKLAVLDVQAIGVPADQAVALGEAMTQELSRRGFFEVISASDIRTLLGVERQKQLLGCGDSSCTAELSGALGARFIMQSSLTRLGDALQLSVQMLDSEKAQSVGRSVRLAKDTGELAAQLPWALAEATATPLPPPPSKALAWTVIGVGAGAFAFGSILAINGFTRQESVLNELSPNNGVYQSYAQYQKELDTVARNKIIGLTAGGAGAALLAVGVFLYTRDSTSGGVALVPTGNGAMLVGGFP